MDTVGVVVWAFLASCVFSMITVKSCSSFACLSFVFVVCGTAALISVRRSDAAMRVLSAYEIVGILQCSGYILADLDMCILWVDGTKYFLLQELSMDGATYIVSVQWGAKVFLVVGLLYNTAGDHSGAIGVLL